MPQPQPAIFVTGTRSHWILQFSCAPGADLDDLRHALTEVRAVATDRDVNALIAFGSDLARRLLPGEVPDTLTDFTTIAGPDRSAPGTQDDLFIWLHSDRHDHNFDVGLAARRALETITTVTDDIPAWVYLDSRDLTGFMDGTANPGIDDAQLVAVIAQDQIGAGGSFVLAQRWVHDLDAFDALPVDDQEQVIGRTKPDSVELDDKAPDSHVSRVEIVGDDGDELALWRRSVPYGTPEQAGLLFLAFAHEPSRFTAMLSNMFGVTDGIHDRLTDFSTPVTGSFYFAPAAETLDRLLP